MIHRDPRACVPLIRASWGLITSVTRFSSDEPKEQIYYDYWYTWNRLLERECLLRYAVEQLTDNQASFVGWDGVPDYCRELAFNYGYE